MGEETRNGDLPPAYCSLYTPGNCSDTLNTSDVIVPDLDEEPLMAPSFEIKSTRIVFIQKVLAIRCIQVAAASGIIAAVYQLGDLEYWLRRNNLCYWILSWFLAYSASVIPLLCWKVMGRKAPYNYFFLAMNTISTAFIWMVVTNGIFKIREEFYIAWIFYAVLTLALLLYSVLISNTSAEFGARDASLITVGLSTLMIAIAAFISYRFDIFPIIYLTLLFNVVCAHAAFRLQVITRGKYHRALAPADIVSAALYSQIDMVRDFANWPSYLIESISDSE